MNCALLAFSHNNRLSFCFPVGIVLMKEMTFILLKKEGVALVQHLTKTNQQLAFLATGFIPLTSKNQYVCFVLEFRKIDCVFFFCVLNSCRLVF